MKLEKSVLQTFVCQFQVVDPSALGCIWLQITTRPDISFFEVWQGIKMFRKSLRLRYFQTVCMVIFQYHIIRRGFVHKLKHNIMHIMISKRCQMYAFNRLLSLSNCHIPCRTNWCKLSLPQSPAVSLVVLVTMEEKSRLLEITFWVPQGLCS